MQAHVIFVVCLGFGFFCSFFMVFKAINLFGGKKKKENTYMGAFELSKNEDNVMLELKYFQVYF